LSRLEIDDAAEKNKLTFLSTPLSLQIPVASRVAANLYMSRGFSPARHGLLHMDPNSTMWNMPSVSRATQQGTDFYTDTFNSAYEAGDKGFDYIQAMFDQREAGAQ
jgi:hypothetical protein